MSKKNSDMRKHILEVAEVILSERASKTVHVADVANAANVAIQTIYYYFQSLGNLISEAQLSRYSGLAEPYSVFLAMAEDALDQRDEHKFWEKISNDLILRWSHVDAHGRWEMAKMLSDIQNESAVNQITSLEFERRVQMLGRARTQCWIVTDLPITPLAALFWGAPQVSNLPQSGSDAPISADAIRDIFFEVAMRNDGGSICSIDEGRRLGR